METPAKFVSVRMLSGFCNEAASGLDYLASMKVSLYIMFLLLLVIIFEKEGF